MRAAGRPGSALVVDEATATFSLVDPAVADEDAPPTLLAQGPLAGGDATATLDTLMARLGDQPERLNDRLPGGRVRGSRPGCRPASRDVDDAGADRRGPDFALARGAALAAAPLAPDATAMAPAARSPVTRRRWPDGWPRPRCDRDRARRRGGGRPAAGLLDGRRRGRPASRRVRRIRRIRRRRRRRDRPAEARRRSLLIGNAVIAFAVIGFASLAVALVVGVRPASSQRARGGTPERRSG